MKVNGLVAHDAGESHAPLGAVGAVGRVQQAALGHDFVVDGPWRYTRQETRMGIRMSLNGRLPMTSVDFSDENFSS